MNLLGSDRFLLPGSSFVEDDVLIKKLLLSHDPDGRHIDSELLLRSMENIMCYATASEVLVSDHLHFDAIAENSMCSIEVVGSQEQLGHTIYKISREILCKCSREKPDVHATTMTLFDFLGNYRWDGKVVLVLAAFAMCYGEFWLIMQLYPRNPLAVSVAMLKQLPSDLIILKPRFKALRLLVKTMVEVAKCIIKFEGLPLQHVELDIDAMVITKYQIYVATYWVIKSTLTCSSHIRGLVAMKHEQVYSNSTAIAVWELSSLVPRLSGICSHLRLQVDVCHQQIETKMHQKLLNLFKETQNDNQEVLHTLFAVKDDLPLKDCSSQVKLGLSDLKNKIAILLVSKPEPLPVEALLLLVQQTYDHPQRKKLEENYEIVWVPIPSSDSWTEIEERSFSFLSNYLPWYSLRQPWLLRSSVVNYIKQVWNFRDEPIMVVLDSQGMATNSNAIDMILIWGARAYPFSASREKELWEEEKWTIGLMVDEIDPLLTKWVEEGKYVCIYGGDNINWIRELNVKMKEITSAGAQFEMVYVGKRNPSEQVRNTIATIDEEKLSASLSFTKIHFFWHRLESMRRSKLRFGKTANTDHILEELAALLEIDENDKGWAVLGRGSASTDIIRLQGREVVQGSEILQCLNLFSARTALEPTSHVGPNVVIPYVDGLIEQSIFCDKCKRPMEKFVVYQCDVIE